MLTSRNRSSVSRYVSVALVSLALLAAGAAGAAGATTSGIPAQVAVRVVGPPPGYATLLPLTRVTTTSSPLVKDGGSCSGTSAAGALELATQGNWEGHWNASFGDYEVISIAGLAYPFQESNASFYWSFWLNGTEASTGVCGAQLSAGAQVLFLPGCFGPECPAAPDVLNVSAPEVAEVGAPVGVQVSSQPSPGGAVTPASGASLSSTGASATADSSGHATLTFSRAGIYAVKVDGASSATPSVPGEASICVHAGNDGNCGTSAPAGSTPTATPGSGAGGFTNASPYKGPFALVASASGLIDGHVYGHRRSPRVLAGTILGHSAVGGVSLELRRSHSGHCSAYDGVSERFRAARCGTGSLFAVSSTAAFSYLLPAALAPGRYVLDINASDAAGNHTTLARGSSRIVFYVR